MIYRLNEIEKNIDSLSMNKKNNFLRLCVLCKIFLIGCFQIFYYSYKILKNPKNYFICFFSQDN